MNKYTNSTPIKYSRRGFLQTGLCGAIGSLLPGCGMLAGRSDYYTNPVFRGLMPDPGVIRHNGTYYAFGTTNTRRLPDGRIFKVLKSDNLIDWDVCGGALQPPFEDITRQYWAPEVAYHDGLFYLYYASGSVETMIFDLRVATSPDPIGPFEDTGNALRDGDGVHFTIDAHPFRDVDGQWYLFYARDYPYADENGNAGTGLAVDRMIDMTKLEGHPVTVARARYPWTLFEADRLMPMYGNQRFDWHTMEGPHVAFRDGRYYCFYSGSNYGTPHYGVDYVVADHVMGPYRDQGEKARVLRGIPGKVRGPGHHSLVKSPDGSNDVMVYHAWNETMTERQMCIDPLRWTPDGPRCDGPSHSKQRL